jgi:L-glutamine:scyllo-inosose aminotransferase/L-glutamine:2-deoxy-scyllo-inosose/3-amino-2,3-dideoxy-scyllo-inosose aminotransferase
LKRKTEKLAIMGGEPVRKKPWPIWPRADENTEKLLKDVLYSGRWTISGCYTGKKPYERQFAEAFARFHNVPYCVPTANGSSALKIALEALGVGYGKEVLVPGLTWVACASSVLAVGAIPILVDIDPDSLCMSLQAARKSITKNTSAIMLVHLYSMIADIEGFLALSKETGIPIIEDCSQAHGAIWKGQRVGTFGKIGIFSMQQSKVLTCGEGGATVTNDKNLYEKMQQLRADGRLYRNKPVDTGQMELEEVGDVQGRNYCMSEFHAAILVDRLKHLDEENGIREQNACYLNSLLMQIEDIDVLLPSPEINRASYYQYCVRLNLTAFGNSDIQSIANALSTELGILTAPIFPPMSNYILYNPLSSKINDEQKTITSINPDLYLLPSAHNASKECLTLPHQIFLASKSGMEDVVEAFVKVKSAFGNLGE